MIPCYIIFVIWIISPNDELENRCSVSVLDNYFFILEDFDSFQILRVKQYLLTYP